MALSASVRELWLANNKVNHNLLQHLTQDMMLAQTPGGGMTVAEHLAELAGTTEYWVVRLTGKDLPETPRLYEVVDDDIVAYTDLELFREGFPLESAGRSRGRRGCTGG